MAFAKHTTNGRRQAPRQSSPLTGGDARIFLFPSKSYKAGEGVRRMVTYGELFALLALIAALVDIFLKIYYNKKK